MKKIKYHLGIVLIMAQGLQAMEVAKEKEFARDKAMSVPISIMADYIINSPLNEDLIQQLEKLDQTDTIYQELLKRELIEQQKVHFCTFDAWERITTLPNEKVAKVALDYQGNHMLSLSADNDISYTTNLSTFTSRFTLSLEAGEELAKIIDLCWHKNEFALISKRKIFLGHIVEKNERRTISIPTTLKYKEPKTCKALNTPGTYVLVELADTSGAKLGMESLSEIKDPNSRVETIPLPCNSPCIALDSDGTIAVAVGDDCLFIVQTQRAQAIKNIPCHFIKQVCISADGTYAVALSTVGDKNTLHLYHLESGSLLQTINSSHLTTIALSPCGRFILMGYKTGKVALYDSKHQVQKDLMWHDKSVSALAWSGDGSTIGTGDQEGKLLYRKLCERALILSLKHILLITKTLQYGHQRALSYTFFKNIYDSLPSIAKDNPNAKLYTQVKEYLQECDICPLCNETGANCTIQCRHKFCEGCLMAMLYNKTCASCKTKIKEYTSPDGTHTVKYEATIN